MRSHTASNQSQSPPSLKRDSKMAAPVSRICRRCICSQAKKTHVTRPKPHIDRIVRVDHAGELGADRIYAGQMAILGRTSVGPTIQVSLLPGYVTGHAKYALNS